MNNLAPAVNEVRQRPEITHELLEHEITVKGGRDPLARQLHGQTWPLRREQFKQDKSPRLKLPEMSMAEWLHMVNHSKEASPFLTLIDGHYLHATVVSKLRKSMDFLKFRNALRGCMLPIEYFSMQPIPRSLADANGLRGKSSAVQNFLIHLSSLDGFHVTSKSIRSILQREEYRTMQSDLYMLIEKWPMLRQMCGSFASDLSVRMIELLNDNPEVQHVLLFSRDPDLLAAVRSAREYSVKLTMVRCTDVPISSELLGETDYVINIVDMLEHLECITDRSFS